MGGMRGEGGRRREGRGRGRGGRRREERGGLSGNVAEEAFCLKSAPEGHYHRQNATVDKCNAQ